MEEASERCLCSDLEDRMSIQGVYTVSDLGRKLQPGVACRWFQWFQGCVVEEDITDLGANARKEVTTADQVKSE
jgi:hypothetical protein